MEILEKLEQVDHILHGNGHTGLIVRVDRIEQDRKLAWEWRDNLTKMLEKQIETASTRFTNLERICYCGLGIVLAAEVFLTFIKK